MDTAYEEAEFIADDVCKRKRNRTADYKDCAVLYRTNAQARLLEERFIIEGIPYDVVGGVNFYARKEIKDILAYLKTIDNGQDDLQVRRIINIPKRGIGATTVNRVQAYAEENEMSFLRCPAAGGPDPRAWQKRIEAGAVCDADPVLFGRSWNIIH